MLFSAEVVESEICKLRGLLQMLHEDQPDVLEDVFQFHVGNLISHVAPDQHGYVRRCAGDMLEAIRRLPSVAPRSGAEFMVMPRLLVNAA